MSGSGATVDSNVELVRLMTSDAASARTSDAKARMDAGAEKRIVGYDGEALRKRLII